MESRNATGAALGPQRLLEVSYAISSPDSASSLARCARSSASRYARSSDAHWVSDVMCRYPFRQGVVEFGCGQCMPCRVNRRRLWQTRMTLEAASSEAVFFLTLTLKPEYLNSAERMDECEPGTSVRDVSVREGQLWLKRLRYQLGAERVRYYLVGEYGERNWRPHYHAVLFGGRGLQGLAQSAFAESWPHGGVHVGVGEWDSYGYIGGYVTKGLTKAGSGLDGRRPEFARMSLRPGIGRDSLVAIRDWCVSLEGSRFIGRTGDVPRSIRVQGKVAPLGRYLVRELREMVGLEVDTKENFRKYGEEVYFEITAEGGRAARDEKRRQVERQALARVRIKNNRRFL